MKSRKDIKSKDMLSFFIDKKQTIHLIKLHKHIEKKVELSFSKKQNSPKKEKELKKDKHR